MKIEIYDRFTGKGRVYYEWSLWDGPNGIDHVHGYATDLVQAFSKILEWKERIGRDYAEEVIADLDTLYNFLQENDTDSSPTD